MSSRRRRTASDAHSTCVSVGLFTLGAVFGPALAVLEVLGRQRVAARWPGLLAEIGAGHGLQQTRARRSILLAGPAEGRRAAGASSTRFRFFGFGRRAGGSGATCFRGFRHGAGFAPCASAAGARAPAGRARNFARTPSAARLAGSARVARRGWASSVSHGPCSLRAAGVLRPRPRVRHGVARRHDAPPAARESWPPHPRAPQRLDRPPRTATPLGRHLSSPRQRRRTWTRRAGAGEHGQSSSLRCIPIGRAWLDSFAFLRCEMSVQCVRQQNGFLQLMAARLPAKCARPVRARPASCCASNVGTQPGRCP